MGSAKLPITAAGPQACMALADVHASAFDVAWNAADLAGVLASPFAFALQAGSPPSGFVVARAVAGEGEILTLAVRPKARRRGTALALVQAAAEVAQAMGADGLWLEVAEDNAAALALYAAAGFAQVGRRKGYYPRAGGAVDALSLRCRLNSAPA